MTTPIEILRNDDVVDLVSDLIENPKRTLDRLQKRVAMIEALDPETSTEAAAEKAEADEWTDKRGHKLFAPDEPWSAIVAQNAAIKAAALADARKTLALVEMLFLPIAA